MQQCIKILFHIYMKLNMFRATHNRSSDDERLGVAYRIWLGKHRWTCFHARWRTATLYTERTCLVGSEVSGTWVGTTRISRMACKKSRSHALWLFPVGLGKRGSVPGKTSHNGKTGGPDSERYHQRPTRIPAEDCAFHPQSFEEAGGCRRYLHWILSDASIFQFKKIHEKLFLLSLHRKYRRNDHFSVYTYFPPTP